MRDPIALITEAADELDAYYATENAGDHPHSVRKLAQAKQANPARAALTALQEQPAQVGVRVGPLLWSKYGEAQGFSAKYSVYEARSGWNCVKYPVVGEKTRIAEGVTEKEAITAAQNDYSSEVLSALQPFPEREEAEVLVTGLLNAAAELKQNPSDSSFSLWAVTRMNVAAAFIARHHLGERS
jgi:hypothetical protein